MIVYALYVVLDRAAGMRRERRTIEGEFTIWGPHRQKLYVGQMHHWTDVEKFGKNIGHACNEVPPSSKEYNMVLKVDEHGPRGGAQ